MPRVSPDAFDEGLDEEALEELLRDDPNVGAASQYLVTDLREHVEADRDLLLRLLHRAETIPADADPKLDALLDALAGIAAAADHADERKVIVFSYFADTIDYVRQYLEITPDPRLRGYQGRMAVTTGAASSDTRQRTVWSFVPNSSGAPRETADTVDLLLSTDVLAEGQNLQQCGQVINFDLPWNPMRLVQRNGRVDRNRLQARVCTSLHFLPRRAKRDARPRGDPPSEDRSGGGAFAIGVKTALLPGDKPVERVFDDARVEIERIAAEDPTFVDEKDAELDAFSGEVFREELRQALTRNGGLVSCRGVSGPASSTIGAQASSSRPERAAESSGVLCRLRRTTLNPIGLPSWAWRGALRTQQGTYPLTFGRCCSRGGERRGRRSWLTARQNSIRRRAKPQCRRLRGTQWRYFQRPIR